MPALRTVIYPVKDVIPAKAVYTALLGIEPTMDQPYYVGYDVGDQHVGLDPNGHAQGMTGGVGYWHVGDIEAALAALAAAGAEVTQAAKDVGGGKLVAMLEDADGNAFGLIQAT
jgi:predicted enzyme related to lactoylglutathione lyase